MECVQFLRDIIKIPSRSCEEERVVKRIKEEMEKIGFHEVIIDKIGNIAGRIGNGPVKILYDSHIDTVDIGSRDMWGFDPFKGKYENGIIYGRGASDNKAAIATMIYAARIIKKKNLDDKITLWILGSVQEEDCDGLAIQYFIENTFKPDFVLLGEATALDIYRGHRGRIELKVITEGKSCHASAPERGINAIYKMQPILKKIEELNENLPVDDFLGKGTVAVTSIECDTGSLNTVPDRCRIYLDRRLTDGETKQSAILELKKIVAGDGFIEIFKYNTPSYTGLKIETEKYFPAWKLDEDHLLVRTGIEAATIVRNKKPRVDKWIFSTNGVATMGRLNIPTIGFGPSEERFAHTTEDQVSIEHLKKAIEFYSIFPELLLKNLSIK